MSWEDENWADQVLASLAPQEGSQALRVPVGSLWTAKHSGRRGRVLWASETRVCLEFAPGQTKQHTMADFHRLYTQTQ